MRKSLIKALLELAEQDERVVLLTADLGFMFLEPFMEKFPRRFFNVGIAEQNMVGIATGLAEAGFIPFIYSIVTFAVLRPYEFIRNGPIMHQLPVRIIGIGGGYEYGQAGHTHHGLEDIGVMRIQPGITVVAPADDAQAYQAFKATYNLPQPIYYRLGKNEANIANLGGRFTLGKLEIIREGRDLLWFTIGPIALEVVKSAEILAKLGIQSTVVIVSSMNPTPVEEIETLLSHFSLAICVEAHYAIGGLGSLIAEIASENRSNCKILRKGVSEPATHSGDTSYYTQMYQLNATALASFAQEELAFV